MSIFYTRVWLVGSGKAAWKKRHSYDQKSRFEFKIYGLYCLSFLLQFIVPYVGAVSAQSMGVKALPSCTAGRGKGFHPPFNRTGPWFSVLINLLPSKLL